MGVGGMSLTLLPPHPRHPSKGRGLGTLLMLQPRVCQGHPGMPRVPWAGLCPAGGAACPPTRLWGTPPALLAHTGYPQTPRGVPKCSVPTRQDRAQHTARPASCSHAGSLTPPAEPRGHRAPQGL